MSGWAIVVPGVMGALAGAAASLLVNEFRDWWRLKRATDGLLLRAEGRAGSRATARVRNESHYCIEDATAYLSLHHDLVDVLDPPLHFRAFISPQHLRKTQEDRLCWSVRWPQPNPMRVDVFPGEWQLLDIADFGADSAWVEIPSELGYSSSQTAADLDAGAQPISSRVFLRAGKVYAGSLKIVSRTSKARRFEIEVDPSNPTQPVRVVG